MSSKDTAKDRQGLPSMMKSRGEHSYWAYDKEEEQV